ncbi:hypothetical protein lerEdw1_017610 [Lerista edwardsae]|nr:hypothetical protein lerEdw1_017610 [Lerista edwardsae]
MRSARSEILSLMISSALWMMCSAAPLTYSRDKEFFRKKAEFTLQIGRDVVAMKKHLRAEFSIGPNKELQLMKERLKILIPIDCHSICNGGDCFNQIRAGLHTYEGYLSQIADALPSYADRVQLLQLGVRNLSTSIQPQMEETGLPTVTYPQANQVLTKLGDKKQVGSYIILDYLQGFLEMIIWVLRHCSTEV